MAIGEGVARCYGNESSWSANPKQKSVECSYGNRSSGEAKPNHEGRKSVTREKNSQSSPVPPVRVLPLVFIPKPAAKLLGELGSKRCTKFGNRSMWGKCVAESGAGSNHERTLIFCLTCLPVSNAGNILCNMTVFK